MQALKPRPYRPILLSHTLAKVNYLSLNTFLSKYKTGMFRWKDLALPGKVEIPQMPVGGCLSFKLIGP